MPGLTTVLLFALATFILTVSPGPGVLYVAARSLAQGRRAGFASMFGIEFGEVVWIAATATGVGAILSTSIAAISVLRYTGLPHLPGNPALARGRRCACAAACADGANLRAGISHSAGQPEGGGVLRRVPTPVPEHGAANRSTGRRARRGLHRHRGCNRRHVRAVCSCGVAAVLAESNRSASNRSCGRWYLHRAWCGSRRHWNQETVGSASGALAAETMIGIGSCSRDMSETPRPRPQASHAHD